MPRRRGSRLMLEVLFLAALAAGLALADVRALTIAGLMLAGWVVASVFEWSAWRGQPHYAAGLPPRYTVPRIDLPPAQPLEPVVPAYPKPHRDEAPTWIASPALRADLLGDWPLAAPAEEEGDDVVELARVSEDTQPEPAPLDPWLVAELPVAPLDEQEPRAELIAPTEPEPIAVLEPAAQPVHDSATRGVARYSLDPLAEPVRRRFGRGDAPPTIEVPARPAGVRPLPGQTT